MLRKTYLWLRFGTIRSVVKSIDGWVASEIEYFGRFNKSIGYWAYGPFDPSGPYRG